MTARQRPGFETRSRLPLARGDPKVEALLKRCTGKLELVLTYHDERKHLPIVELREAA